MWSFNIKLDTADIILIIYSEIETTRQTYELTHVYLEFQKSRRAYVSYDFVSQT